MKDGCGICARLGRGCHHHPDNGQQPKSSLTVLTKEATQDRFLEAFAKVATVTHAAQVAEIGRDRHYEWLKTDPDYAKRFEDAFQQATDALEAEARRRAVDGVEEPVGWYKGEPGGYIQRYSDTLLIFLLKGAKPDVYRERYDVEHRGRIDHAVGVAALPAYPKSEEDWAEMVRADREMRLVGSGKGE